MRNHFFLRNPRGDSRVFNVGRQIENDDDVPEKDPQAYTSQKIKLRNSLTQFSNELLLRAQERTLEVPAHIDYIEIDFFAVFGNQEPYHLKNRFKRDFGLEAVKYFNFNKSILFAINNNEDFDSFLSLVQDFFNSPDDIAPQGRPYAIATLIYDMRLLSTERILKEIGSTCILSLITRTAALQRKTIPLRRSLISFLTELRNENADLRFHSMNEEFIEVQNAFQDELRLLAKNFDIIQSIASIRYPFARTNEFNLPYMDWGIDIDASDESVAVGILDNGVSPIRPLSSIIVDYGLDITNLNHPNPTQVNHPHGTSVAMLAALGFDIFRTEQRHFQSIIKIVPIKIIPDHDGFFSLRGIEDMIVQAVRKGVKLFNLSVVGNFKKYNEDVSEFANLLDRLAYENDILIVIAAGNQHIEEIELMQSPANEASQIFHRYPNHFYNPFKISDEHFCAATNLATPGESLNNLTIGASAENFNDDHECHLTPFKNLPAYYTRKYHIDHAKSVNGTFLSRSALNMNLNKPDLVFPGGDVLNNQSGIQVAGLGIRGNDFFYLTAGTSFAAPLATNVAAKLLNLYPTINMQSVKAIMINSASQTHTHSFLNDLVEEVREELSNSAYQMRYADLGKAERRKINERLNAEDLHKRLVGYGEVNLNRCLFSDEKQVTVLIQDSIALETHKAVNLKLPIYLKEFSRSSYIVKLKATLCFKFKPNFGNQLGYNPLHISFNFAKSVSRGNPGRNAQIISDSSDRYFENIVRGIDSPQERAKARKQSLGIKSSLQSWSEDYFPTSTKPFSNTQQLEINITKEELEKIRNELTIIVRCTYKRDLPQHIIDELKSGDHPFSIAVNISERSNRELTNYDLYSELQAVNDLEIITESDLNIDENLEIDH